MRSLTAVPPPIFLRVLLPATLAVWTTWVLPPLRLTTLLAALSPLPLANTGASNAFTIAGMGLVALGLGVTGVSAVRNRKNS